jgi:hypothetical protein
VLKSEPIKECPIVTPEQEAQLQRLEVDIQIADKHLRLVQVKKQIAETELDIVGLQQTLRQQIDNPLSA